MGESYKTIYEKTQHILTEKKSKFIATAIPVTSREEAEEKLAVLRKEYKDATHNVFAYRIKEEVGIWERQSDDGEPSGTAGMPILDMLRGEELVNILMVVTRYYGGTLLGTGGLVRAYGHSAKESLIGKIIEKTKYTLLSVQVEYPLAGKIQHHLESDDFVIKDIIYTDITEFQAYTKSTNVNTITETLTQLTNAQIKITSLEESYGFFQEGNFTPN